MDIASRVRWHRRLLGANSTPLHAYLLFLFVFRLPFVGARADCCFVPLVPAAWAGCRPLRPLVGRTFRSGVAYHSSPRECPLNAQGDDEDGVVDNLQEKLNDFLDTPFFDPDDESLSDDTNDGVFGSFGAWFASLVKNDYETAEALYVGIIFFVLVVGTQELLRMQMYGNSYVPFTRIGSGGRLF